MSTSGRAWFARPQGDAGMGLILVVGVTAFVFTIAATAVAFATNGIKQSRERTGYEQSLALAESGIDRTLAELQVAFNDFNRDYPVPSQPSVAEPTPWCQADPVEFPAAPADGAGGVFSDETAEKAWARTQLEALVAVPGCVQSDDRGEYVVLKPVSPLVNGTYPKAGKIYSLSAIPSFAEAGARTRVVKSEYIFMPYRPTHAVLTAGTVSIASSTKVLAAHGVDPSAASVHSNATVTGVGNPEVTGPVTSTGPSTFSSSRFPGGAVTQLARQAIPKVNAEAFYYQAPGSDPAAMSTWYDLCPDGQVRSYGASGPCTGTPIGTATSSTRVRGWTYGGGTNRVWTATRDLESFSGTYYAHHGNISYGNGTASVPKLTLIASAENRDNCVTKRYGNIEWERYDMQAPAYRNLWTYADSDVVTHANFTAGSGITAPPVISGMFVAGDQISMQTSSAGAVGSIVAADQCSTANALPFGMVSTSEVKNPTIYFDPNSEAPFTSIITTSLWLDYSR